MNCIPLLCLQVDRTQLILHTNSFACIVYLLSPCLWLHRLLIL